MKDCRCSKCKIDTDGSMEFTAQFKTSDSLETHRYVLCEYHYKEIKTLLYNMYHRDNLKG